MRLLQLLPFVGAAVAQVAVVQGVFETISSDITALDSAITAFSGDPGPLTSASNQLLADIKEGTTTISGSSEVDLAGATQIAQFVTGLQTSLEGALQNLVAAKPQIVAAGAGGTVYANLVEQKAASIALADATVSKTPAALQSVAQQLSGGVAAAVQVALDAYADQEGASSAPSTPSTPSTGDSGSAPPTEEHPAGHSGPVSSSVAAPAAANPDCAATPAPTVKTSYKPTSSSAYPTKTTGAAPPTKFTGAAVAHGPAFGLAAVAAGVIAVM